jgi:CHAT domain-containing protein
MCQTHFWRLTGLAYSRERAERTGHSTLIEKALLVAMPETLPFVEKEIEDLKELLAKSCIDTTIIQNPGRAEVLSEIPKHSIIHFACHGYSAKDPSESNLHVKEPLMVSDLTSLNILYLPYLISSNQETMTPYP